VQLANIRAGRAQLETEPVLVAQLIAHAIDATRPQAPRREFRTELEPRLLAEADPTRIDQVIRNLLVNAVKYSPDDTPIEIRANRNGPMLEIGVRDYGAGIADAELPRVVDRFHRSEHWNRSTTPGMGLGLYLARHVVDAHGGNIWIERPDTGGTRMVFSLPAVDAED
jgi:signal transduction histidine kinase